MARRDSGKKAAKGGSGRSSRPKTKAPKRKKQDWPQQRAVLFKPDRLKYVHKIDRPNGCVFCAAKERGLGSESLLLYRDAHAMVVMNKYPYNSGHLLVLPTRHCGDLLALDETELNAVTATVRRAVAALSEEYKPAGFNVGLNLGSAAGAGIPEHLHYHVVPRWNGDTNFFPLIAETKVVVETLEQTFDRLLPYFGTK
ncbi:MAG TPA: HIT domain-containing protein [Bdellovibrionales bacterium]|nr:HIT domain-containing protein [Bdellovibrionales bacterium]